MSCALQSARGGAWACAAPLTRRRARARPPAGGGAAPRQASSDFEQVARAHDAYLSALSLQTFRHVPAVCDALDEILDACDALCALAEGALDRVAAAAVRARVAPAASASAASAPPPARPYDPAELSALSSRFAERAAFLLGFLRSVSSASPGAAPHLAQLLLRVDFNGFFSAASAAAAAGAGA